MAEHAPTSSLELLAFLERSFDNALASEEAASTVLHAALLKFREACENELSRNLLVATANKIEERLWNAHIKLNNRFRPPLRHLKKSGNSKIVEFRKLSKEYEKFIKSSQGGYRRHTLQMILLHTDCPEFARVFEALNPGSNSNGEPAREDLAPDKLLLRFCYRALIRLGDLSRYRETELPSNPPRWRPAINYYNLAQLTYPRSGTTHNQLAVIAQHSADHFGATYHLHRAIAVEEPFPSARQNLGIEFKRILSYEDDPTTNDSKTKTLISRFLRLHASAFTRDTSVDLKALEEDVLQLFNTEARHLLPSETPLFKLIIINIAAECIAQDELQLQAESATTPLLQNCLDLLRLNVRTFSHMLRILDGWLRTLQASDPSILKDLVHVLRNPALEDFSNMLRAILPALRLYSTWLQCNVKLIAGVVIDETLKEYVENLWQSYASCLTTLASSFETGNLAAKEDMLEEDYEIIGFKPLQPEQTQSLRHFPLRRKSQRDTRERLVEEESNELLFRMKCVLLTGGQLTEDQMYVPLRLVGCRFIYSRNVISHEIGRTSVAGEQRAEDLGPPAGFHEHSQDCEARAPQTGNLVGEPVGLGHDRSSVLTRAQTRLFQGSEQDDRATVNFAHNERQTLSFLSVSSSSPPPATNPDTAELGWTSAVSTRRPTSSDRSSTSSHRSKMSLVGRQQSPLAMNRSHAPQKQGMQDYGMGGFLFGAGNSAWTPTGPELKRLSTDDSHSLRRIGSSPHASPRQSSKS